jgi:hypothetical protein
MKTRKAPAKWVLPIVGFLLILFGHPAMPGTFSEKLPWALGGAACLFIIGWILDANREKRG